MILYGRGQRVVMGSEGLLAVETSVRWQAIIDLTADLARVPAALVLQGEAGSAEATVVAASRIAGNPYQAGERLEADALFCRGVLQEGMPWQAAGGAPERMHGLGSFAAVPLRWASGEPFGALCVLAPSDQPPAPAVVSLLGQIGACLERDLSRPSGTAPEARERKPLPEWLRRAEAEAEELLAQVERSRHALLRMTEERDQLREALQEVEARYRALFESNPHPMWIYDGATRSFLAVNNAALALYGYSRPEWRALCTDDLFAPEEAPAAPAVGQDEGAAPLRVVYHQKRDGTRIAVELAESRFVLAGRDAWVVRAHDVTERLQLEEQLRQAQKMEAVGRLAGGLAHDFNNFLTPILSYSELLAMQLPADTPLRWYAEQITKTAERAASLPRQLLAFSRRQLLQPEQLRLEAVIADMDEMLRRLIGEHIDLVCASAPGMGLASADPGQMEQVILNLVVNARDAMPRGGRLLLETANADLDEAYARQHLDAAPGRYVVLSVSDTGQGIPPEVLPRIFEPFFTTKERGKGTGLGLSTVYGIVKQSGGHVEVESEVGRGTTFRVYLPRVDAEPSREEAPPVGSAVPGGSETILVVEDEAAVRAAVADMLRASGYQVLLGGSGPEALQVSAEYSGPIHLLLTDVVMPGMSGPALAQRLVANHPGMKVLYMSGHTSDTMLEYGTDAASPDPLRKPFTLATLAARVRERLG